MIIAKPYSKDLKDQWNDFVDNAVNGHFMFNRDFMEYHSDRFQDASILFFGEDDSLLAIFPANKYENTLCSHQGLTFGGIIAGKKLTSAGFLEVFDELVRYASLHGFEKIVYKRVPDFYTTLPAQYDLYALFKNNACLYRRDINSTIDFLAEYKYTKGRKWSINKAKKNGVAVVEAQDPSQFWKILSNVLVNRHGVKPTHSLDEISKLKEKFPNNIKIFTAILDGEPIAGSLLFINKNVVHTQYMANTEYGRDIGALDYLIHVLLMKYCKEKRYFNFGISTEKEGRYINEGLLAQKEGFGARCTVQDFYEIELT
ncbi:GNAT family N-acetyltransferase [Comamonas aquatica]|nr:GNAT family N-acetyltransferase [Comamonas aquatica]